MKKKLFIIFTILSVTLLSACGSSDGKNDNLAQYVKLGYYKDLDVEYVTTEITEEDIQDAIAEELEGMAEYTDKNTPAEMGDVIDIRVKATYESGEILYDFYDDAYDMTIGDEEWGKEFDELIVGCVPGDSGQVTYKFDEDFDDMIMCGHTVTLDYAVESVYNTEIPELNDALLSEMGYDSEEAYREYIVNMLKEDNEYTDRENFVQEILSVVKASSVFSDIPASVIKEARESVEEGYEAYADLVDCDVEDVYEMMGVTEDDLEKEALDYAKDMIVTDAIRVKEGIELDDDTYDKMLKDFMDEEEYDNITEVYEDYERSELESIFLDQLIKDFLVSSNS